MATATATPAATTKLPSPAERPGSDVVIYDGHCRICTAQIRTIERLLAGGRLSYLSLHDPQVSEQYPDLSHEDMMRQMYVVDRTGGRHGGAAAVRHLSRRLPRLWWVAPLMHIPGSMPLWQWLYRFVARNRYRFGKLDACENDSCAVHFK
jgi:predicted DCC family thiol-disulfide oxidoreductase YuxK